MDDWAFVLVIILSIFLALFLLLGIVLVILLIKVTMQIKRVTKSAENTALNVEGFVGNMTKFGSPMLIGRSLVKQAMKQAKKYKKDKKD